MLSQESLQPLLRRCIDSIEGWCDLSVQHLSCRPLGGGVTNQLYLVENTKVEPSYCILRINCESKLINRALESDICNALGEKGFRLPKTYFHFENGKCEEFLRDYDALTNTQELQTGKILQLVARQLARIHANFRDYRAPSEFGSIFEEITSQIAFINPAEFPLLPELEDLKRRIDGLDGLADSFLLESSLCHLDFLGGNLLYKRSTHDLIVIDWEYARPSCPIVFDLVNFFAGITESQIIDESHADIYEICPNSVKLDFIKYYCAYRQIPVGDPVKVLTLLNYFHLVNEIRWIVWALYMEQVRQSKYYHVYATKRWKHLYQPIKALVAQ
jgi:thiamine kinase-like enzyme